MLPTLFVLSFIAIFALLPTLYIRYVLCRHCASIYQRLCWFFLAIVVIALGLMMWLVTSAGYVHFFTFLVACVILPVFVFTLVSAIGWGLSCKWPKSFRIANYTGATISGILCIAAMYGVFFGWKQISVKQVDVSFDNLPEQFDGYRIAQLSDWHVGAYGNDPSFIDKVVDQTNALHPDMIVFTGDLVSLDASEIAPFERSLLRLSAPDGIYSVLGNHDYCRYGFNKSEQQQQEGCLQLQEMEKRMGWQLLVDEHRIIHRGTDSIAIAGVGNISKPPYLHAGDLHKAIEGLSDSVFTVLLSHDPSHWRMEVLERTTIPLTLSGHTHAAQLKLGSCSPAAIPYREWSGLYEETANPSLLYSPRYLFVSEGLGGVFPFRLGATPQIVLITLRRTK